MGINDSVYHFLSLVKYFKENTLKIDRKKIFKENGLFFGIQRLCNTGVSVYYDTDSFLQD